MAQKFEDLRTGLDSIDAVLNEQMMNARDASDIGSGFDPSKAYTPEEIIRLHFSGVSALKKGGNESRYLLLEVRLEGEGGQFCKLYLRGFDAPIDAHLALADNFLTGELRPVASPILEMPRSWSHGRRELACVNEGLTLTVSAIGGGRFDLKNNAINLSGSSMAFGSIPPAYRDKFRNLLEQLVQKPAYNGFQISFG